MAFSRRSFIAAVSTAFAAAKFPSVTGAPRSFPSGDILLSVSFKRNDLRPAMASLRARIAEIDLARYRFVPMELPRGLDYARNEVIAGIPMRHLRVWDNVNAKILNRLDVCARPI